MSSLSHNSDPYFSYLTFLNLYLGALLIPTQIFKTTALLETKLTADSEFSTQDIYQVEQSTGVYLKELLAKDESLRFLDGRTCIVDVEVDVQQQLADGPLVILDSRVDVYHFGHQGLVDLAALLTFLVNKNNTDSTYRYLDRSIGMGSKIETMSFGFVNKSNVLTNLTTQEEGAEEDSSRTDNEKTLIVVTSLLSVAIFALSGILIWIGGGWLMLRKQVRLLILREEEMTRMTQDIKLQPTQDTEEGDADVDASPSSRGSQTQFTYAGSGILGVNPYYASQSMQGPGALQGLGIKMTPRRAQSGEILDDLATPMSEYSDTDRGPIGIMSMRKMIPTDQEDECDESIGKKLDY